MVRHNAEEVVRVIAGDIGLALPAFGPIKQWCLSSVFYSAAARLSLCSIWDGEENDYGQQTVEHFKGKLVEMLYAYASSSTSFKDELNLKASARIREVAEELFQTYWQTGNFYRGSSEKHTVSWRFHQDRRIASGSHSFVVSCRDLRLG